MKLTTVALFALCGLAVTAPVPNPIGGRYDNVQGSADMARRVTTQKGTLGPQYILEKRTIEE